MLKILQMQCYFFINKKIKEDFLNIGSGKDYSIDWYTKFIMREMN